MPGKSALLLEMLGVGEEREKRDFAAARFGADIAYGFPHVALKKGTAGTLFPPLASEL
jgi:methionyl-tRNA synthetase